ncbi:hypothetical protein DFH06DRAFT_1477354 [Mycena polygramma]|nr:hypothetical protein DFH06DRAFT_1477354 [Mycena polygramma]
MPASRRRAPATHAETPYKDYLHTNFVPSDDECSRIRDLVARKTQELEEITAKIGCSQKEYNFQHMLRQRDQLQEFIESHLAAASLFDSPLVVRPVQQIPVGGPSYSAPSEERSSI